MPADAAAGYGDRIGTMHGTSTDVAVPLDLFDAPDVPRPVHPRRRWPRSVAPARPALRSAPARGVSSTAGACSCPRRSRRSPRATASVSTTRRSTRCATGASGSRSTPTRWVATRRRARSGTVVRCRRSRSPIPSTGSSRSCRPTACAANDDHYLRLDAVTTALYEDLGLAAAGAPGRDKPFPSVELTAPTG